MRKNGISLVELIVASAILAVMMAVSLQLLGLVASGRKAVQQRQTAVREAGNFMQRASALPWDKLDQQTLEGFSLSGNTADELQDARLIVTVLETPSAELKTKRISISITWKDNKGQLVAPVKLTAWRHQ